MGNEPTGDGQNVTIGQNGQRQQVRASHPNGHGGGGGSNGNYNHQQVNGYKNGNVNGKQVKQSAKHLNGSNNHSQNVNVAQNQNHYKQQHSQQNGQSKQPSHGQQVYGAQYQHPSQNAQYQQATNGHNHSSNQQNQQYQQQQYQKYIQQQQMQHHQNGNGHSHAHNNANNTHSTHQHPNSHHANGNNNYASYSKQSGHGHYNYPHQKQAVHPISTKQQRQRPQVVKVNKQRPSKGDEEKNNGFAITKTKSLQDFELKTLVGKGSFGQVWQVVMKSNQKIYALKILKKKDLVARKQVTHTNTERQILANIDHPFLVSLRFAFQTKTKLYMVMDFFNGGELFYHLQKEGKFTENRAKFYSAEICLAIECLHDNGITYRDLKPENILLDQSGHIKITDFGLSKQLANEAIANDANCITRTFCGSPEYLAPEMLQQNGYSFAVDWWSFGTILYEMICGLPPFYDQNIQKMYQNILYQPIPFYKFMSKSSIELISRLLDKNCEKRIKCKQLKQHLFYKDIDWDKLFRKEIEPPFKPKVNGPADRQNFEKIQGGSQAEKTYLKCTPSLKSESVIAAADQFPNFTFDETQDMINID